METANDTAVSLSARIEQFAAMNTPPVSPVVPSKIKPAGRNTQIASLALVAAPILLIFLTRVIGGQSFMGDVLSFGLTGFACVALVYAASTWGSVYFGTRKSRSSEKWVAVGILERQKNYDSGVPQDMIHLELEDGRRVTVKADPELAGKAEPGKIGWASIKNATLLKLA